ncbi:phosphotransferase [Cognatishimia sp. WU-CL00825]|uniref:aminoglycoside phosphotransferase family protein n=1 Tax=Cognatishimia sp. WU-CL00825 TaxID=3127658 RepID=UPI0031028F9B
MPDRFALIQDFLSDSEWQNATRSDLAGDASNRRYERLRLCDGRRAVLMDAPPEKGENVHPFVAIAKYLKALDLSAPRILREDAEHGFLLLEDLGDDLFARVVANDTTKEPELYRTAVDVLLDLHQAAPPNEIAEYTAPIMANMSALAWRWYLRTIGTEFEDQAQRFEQKFEPILARYAPCQNVLIQRDYHAENLLWLPNRTGSARVGLLDFQDALVGHRAYDLVSLLQDARRDVSPETEIQMRDLYVAKSGSDPAEFDAAYHVLGAQRNLRIIGVFARLCLHFGKPHYVDLIPRVWGLLERDLQHPALSDVAQQIKTDLPKPTAEILHRLKEQCQSIPTL